MLCEIPEFQRQKDTPHPQQPALRLAVAFSLKYLQFETGLDICGLHIEPNRWCDQVKYHGFSRTTTIPNIAGQLVYFPWGKIKPWSYQSKRDLWWLGTSQIRPYTQEPVVYGHIFLVGWSRKKLAHMFVSWQHVQR